MTTANFHYRAIDGDYKEGSLSLHDYELAERHSMRTSGLVNKKYPDADPRFGSAFEQGMQSLGIFPRAIPEKGIAATPLRDIVTGECMTQRSAIELASGNTISAPSVPVGSSTPATRVFLPEVIMNLVNEKLVEDFSPEVQAFNSLIAMDQTIQSEIYTRPRIDVTAPRTMGSRPISQNALPRNMVSISTSQVSYALPTVSIGLQISDQAMASATIDLVSLIVAQQSEAERFRNLWTDVGQIISGNTDAGESALSPVNFTTYDSGASNGTVTQTGWLNLLYDNERKVSYNAIVAPLSVVQAIVDRVGRPLMYDPKTTGTNTGNAGSYGFDAPPNVINWMVGLPSVMIVPDGTIPASHFIALDTRYALMRVRNASASYSAVQQMVLQRTNEFRWDYGEHVHRMFPDDQNAIKVVDISNSQ
jgi:hypothetical protein